MLIENFRPGTMERFGFGYEALQARNPKLIYASITGYGSTGVLSNKIGFDLVMQGFSGLMELTGPENGEPHRLPIPVCDIVAGLFLTIGVLTALQGALEHGERPARRRRRCSKRPYPHSSTRRRRYSRPTLRPRSSDKSTGAWHAYQVFKTASDHITIGVAQQNLWIRFCPLIGRLDLEADPRFDTNTKRVSNIYDLVPIIEETLASKSSNYWLNEMEKAGRPCRVIQTTDRALSNDHANARAMVVPVMHPTARPTKTPGIPIKLSDTPGAIRSPAPLLGEHTEQVLKSIGAEI